MNINEYYVSKVLKLRYENIKDKIQELRDNLDDDNETIDELDDLVDDFYEYARKQSN